MPPLPLAEVPAGLALVPPVPSGPLLLLLQLLDELLLHEEVVGTANFTCLSECSLPPLEVLLVLASEAVEAMAETRRPLPSVAEDDMLEVELGCCKKEK